MELTLYVIALAAVFASLVFAALLAWYFTRQILNLRLAFAAAAEGQLAPRFQQQSSNDELSDLGRAFDQMSARLKHMIERQTKLLHDVSHELRSPLARVQAAIGLAHQQPERIAVYLERIEKESGRMDNLVGELLTLARLEAGAYSHRNELIDFNELLEQLVADAQLEADMRECELIFECQSSIMLHGQAELLNRACENVLRNAIKYSPRSSKIHLELALEQKQEDQQGWAKLRISDQGPGVPEHEITSIFEAFYRSSNAQQTTGHGLGLAISHHVVQHFGGHLSAHNLPTGGFCVEISLPCAASKPIEHAPQ